MKKQTLVIAALLTIGGCAARKPEVFHVYLKSSNRWVDVMSQRIDNKDCPTGATQAIFDDKGAIIGHVAFGGNAWYCHGIDQLEGVAQGVGVGVGLSNLKPAHGDTNNNVNSNLLSQEQKQWLNGYGIGPWYGSGYYFPLK